MPTPRTSFVWLTNTGQRWKVSLQVYVGLYGYFASLISFVLLIVAFFAGFGFLWVAAGLWALYGVGLIAVYIINYHFIRCPKCDFNPTRCKADGRPMNDKVAWNRIGSMTACPKCGDAGIAGEENQISK